MTKLGEARFQSAFLLLLHFRFANAHKFCCVDLIGRSWRHENKPNKIHTYLRSQKPPWDPKMVGLALRGRQSWHIYIYKRPNIQGIHVCRSKQPATGALHHSWEEFLQLNHVSLSMLPKEGWLQSYLHDCLIHQCASNSAAYRYQIAIGCKHGEGNISYPCTGWSESNLKLCTNFEIYEKKIVDIF